MQTALLIIHVLIAAAIIGLVLLQHGKGADMGAAFGSGSAGSLFGASGSANFLSRSTAVLAALFFLTSLGLSVLSMGGSGKGVVLGNTPTSSTEAPASAPAPAVPVPPADAGAGAASQAAPAATEGADSKTKDIPK